MLILLFCVECRMLFIKISTSRFFVFACMILKLSSKFDRGVSLIILFFKLDKKFISLND